MRRLLRVAPLAAALAFLVPAFAGDAAKRLFWKVASDKGEVWLLGSIHVASEDFYPLPKEVEEAYKNSTALAVEADVTQGQAETQALIMKKGKYEEGDSLGKHISKATMKAFKEKGMPKLEKAGLPLEAAKTMKPWLLAILVEQVTAQLEGMQPDLGIDIHFLKKAHEKEKKIVELEGAESQVDLLAGLSDELQEKFLLSILEDDDKAKEALEGIVEAWKKGDAAKLEGIEKRQLKETPGLEPVMEKIVDDRNTSMTKKIEGFLGEKGSTFVVVGALHLVGDKGIVAQLEKTKKYKIEQVAVTEPKKEEKKEPAGSGAK